MTTPPNQREPIAARSDIRTAPVVARIPERLWLSAASRLVSQTTPNREAAAKRLVTAAPVHGIDLSFLWGTVGRDGRGAEEVRQVVLAVPGAGRTLMLFQSEPGAEGAGSAEGLAERVASINAACAHFERRFANDSSTTESGPDVRLAQGLPEPSEKWAVGAFEGAGFRRVGNLAYLRRSLKGERTRSAGEIDWPPGIRVVPFSDLPPVLRTDGTLIEALESSYVDTLDCPELCGLRETADVLASHRATGIWDPSMWWVVFDGEPGNGGRASGCLLLNRCPEQRAVELVYVGLSPSVRGRGIASRLLGLAIASAARGPATDELTCAVDRRNQPALNLYGRAGFKAIAERVAFVRPIGP